MATTNTADTAKDLVAYLARAWTWMEACPVEGAGGIYETFLGTIEDAEEYLRDVLHDGTIDEAAIESVEAMLDEGDTGDMSVAEFWTALLAQIEEA